MLYIVDMNKKYIKYIDYIVNNIEPPYFNYMRDHHGLKDNEILMILSKVFNEPVTIKGKLVYDSNGNNIYYEDTKNNWSKYEYSTYDNDNEIYSEDSHGYWIKKEYNINGNLIYSEDSNGHWYKREYDSNGDVIYHEGFDGVIIDKR
jgi:hypothetical protein